MLVRRNYFAEALRGRVSFDRIYRMNRIGEVDAVVKAIAGQATAVRL